MRSELKVGAVAALGAIVASAGVAFTVVPARADRGHVVISKANVSVHNAGQKAIIGWNGKEEVLILSTDLSAGGKAKVLEFLPLPSQPSEVKKAELRSFTAVEELIAAHAPIVKTSKKRGWWPWGAHLGGTRGSQMPPPVEVVFHEQIDAHDITIVKTTNLEGFLSWVRDFVKKHGGSLPDAGRERLSSVVQSYLSRGYHYFVLDIISLSESLSTVPPISYRFPSDHLFFPLLVSSLDVGGTEISLFLLTPHGLNIWGTRTGFSSAFYREKGRAYSNQDPGEPVKFLLSRYRAGVTGGRHIATSTSWHGGSPRTTRETVLDDVAKISSSMSDLFVGWDRVQFTAARYKGPVSILRRDFVIRATPQQLTMGVTWQSQNEVRWQADPVVREAAQRWREEMMAKPDQARLNYTWRLLETMFLQVYRSFSEKQKAAMQRGQYLPYRELTPQQQKLVLRGAAWKEMHWAQFYYHPGSYEYPTPEFDPLMIPAPAWYWSLGDSQVLFKREKGGEIRFSLRGGHGATDDVIPPPRYRN